MQIGQMDYNKIMALISLRAREEAEPAMPAITKAQGNKNNKKNNNSGTTSGNTAGGNNTAQNNNTDVNNKN